jgi:eukaryotic translation initiation factor 2C
MYLNNFCLSGIPPQDHLLLVGKVLKSIWFITSHTNQICRYRLKSFGGPANEHTFTKNENEQITVADYFNDEWKIRLRHPHLSVVELFNPAQKNQSHFVPMELVTVDEWQLNLIPITPEQRAKATKKTVIRPGECYRIIQSFANERRFNQDPCLETFGLTVDVNKMLMLPARILPPPKIIYKSSHGDQGDVIERVQIGERWLNNRFDKTCEIHAWAIVFVSEHKTNNQRIGLTRDFAERIPQVSIEISSI